MIYLNKKISFVFVISLFLFTFFNLFSYAYYANVDIRVNPVCVDQDCDTTSADAGAGYFVPYNDGPIAAKIDDIQKIRVEAKDYAFAVGFNAHKKARLEAKLIELRAKVIDLQLDILSNSHLESKLSSKSRELTTKTDEFIAAALAAKTFVVTVPDNIKSKIKSTAKSLSHLLIEEIRPIVAQYWRDKHPPTTPTSPSNSTSTPTSTPQEPPQDSPNSTSTPPSGQRLTAQLWAEYPLGTKVTQVPKGTAVYLVWNSTNATECHKLAGAGFDTNNATSGYDQVSPLAGTTVFSIQCSNPYGSTQANARVEVTSQALPPNSTSTPIITSLDVSSGPIGTHVVIRGSNFLRTNKIMFGPKISFNNVAPSSTGNGTILEFNVPSGINLASENDTGCSSLDFLVTAGNYEVKVVNDSGTSNSKTFSVVPKTVLELQSDIGSYIKGNNNGTIVNKSKNVIACINSASQLEAVIDSYLTKNTFNANNWDGSSWGRFWLSQYSAYLLGIKGWELKNQLTEQQKEKLRLVLSDASDESSIVYDKCGQEPGNSCSEDYVGFVAAIAAAKLNGLNSNKSGYSLDSLEEDYIKKAFSTSSGYGLTYEKSPWDDIYQVKMYNHGGENPHYAALLFVHLNNAAYAYALGQGTFPSKPRLPSYYIQPTMKPLFNWIQSKVGSDGSQYLDGVCHRPNGSEFLCGDNVANATPKQAPAGRFVRAFLGDSAFLSGKYTFEDFVSQTGGNLDVGRIAFYNKYNVSWVSGQNSSQKPTAQLWAEYPLGTKVTQVPKGTAVYLVWNSTNATECHKLAGAGFDTNNATSGYDQVSPLAGTTVFSIQCSNPYGSTQANARVEVIKENDSRSPNTNYPLDSQTSTNQIQPQSGQQAPGGGSVFSSGFDSLLRIFRRIFK
jgi:cytochrome c